jgi:hypothetical protein
VLRSELALWAYTSSTTSDYPLIVAEYGDVVEALEFTTVAPGGFGNLACVIKLPNARLSRWRPPGKAMCRSSVRRSTATPVTK